MYNTTYNTRKGSRVGWYQKYVNSEYYKEKVSGEAKGQCPNCNGGDDRFWIFPDGGFGCRQCEPENDSIAFTKIVEFFDGPRRNGVSTHPDHKKDAAPKKPRKHLYTHGTETARKVIFFRPDGERRQKWERFDAKARKWVTGLAPIRQKDLIYGRRSEYPRKIVVLEGEKDVDTARRHHQYDASKIDFVSGPGGAGFCSLPWKEFAGVDQLFFFYDADSPGRRGAEKAARAAKKALPSTRVYWYARDGKDGDDLSDAFDQSDADGVRQWLQDHFDSCREIKSSIKIQAGRDGIEQKDERVLRRVLKYLGIKHRFNKRSKTHEIDQDGAIRRFTGSDGWTPLDDRFDALFRSHMKRRYTYQGAGENSREVPLSFTDSEYNRLMTALGDLNSEVDPFLEWLEGLPQWDQNERLPTLFTELFGCEQDSKSEFFARHIFCASIQRTLKPGTKIDVCPIIASDGQGVGKSSFLQRIFPEELRRECFCDSVNLSEPNVETILTIGPSVLVEVPELSGFFGASMEKLKSFVTSSIDSYRPKYARSAIRHERHWVMIATADRTTDVVPADHSGNRRFPILVLPGNDLTVMERWAWIDENRDQLWAEALAYVRGGGVVHWTPALEEEWSESRKEHERADHSLIDLITETLDKNEMYRTTQIIGEMVNLARCVNPNSMDIPEYAPLTWHQQDRLRKALRSCGWKYGNKWKDKKYTKHWYFPDEIPF